MAMEIGTWRSTSRSKREFLLPPGQGESPSGETRWIADRREKAPWGGGCPGVQGESLSGETRWIAQQEKVLWRRGS